MTQLPLFDIENAEKYSIAICPDEATTAEIAEMKTLLFGKIGHYPSRNARAHLSLFETAFTKPSSNSFSKRFYFFAVPNLLSAFT